MEAHQKTATVKRDPMSIPPKVADVAKGPPLAIRGGWGGKLLDIYIKKIGMIKVKGGPPNPIPFETARSSKRAHTIMSPGTSGYGPQLSLSCVVQRELTTEDVSNRPSPVYSGGVIK